MDFQTAVKTVLFEKYATFTGRAARSEFWWFTLFSVIVSLITAAISDGVNLIYSLAVLLPSLAVGVRRLHDLGRTGWWMLISLIPLIGLLVLLFFFVQRGTQGPNAHGDDPLAA